MLHMELRPAQIWREWEKEWAEEAATLTCEVTDGPGAYTVQVDVPGFRREDLSIEVRDHRLHIAGERQQTPLKEDEKVLRQERRYGKFYRVFNLPDGIVEDKVEAKFTDGVLQIVLPKATQVGRKVAVN